MEKIIKEGKSIEAALSALMEEIIFQKKNFFTQAQLKKVSYFKELSMK